MRVALESEVAVNPRYKTLFYGLKKNHPRHVAVVYPILFLTRRVLFSVIILFLMQVPFFGVLLLMMSCLAMMAFVFSEAHWEDSIIN